MADNIAVSEGSGKSIRSDDVSGQQYQYVKLDAGGDGVAKPIIQGGTDGLPVDVLSVAGDVSTKPKVGQTWPISAASAIPVSDNGGSFTIDAPVAAPAFVRLSDGASPIATLPVSGTVAVTQSTAAAVGSAWPIKISDGTDTVGISTVSATKALKVDVVQSVTDSTADLATMGKVLPMAGLYNEAATDPSSGQAAAVRITTERAFHANIRKSDGTELGVSAAPFRIDPTDTTAQTVKLKDASGTAYSDTNPLPVQTSGSGRTRVTKSVTLTASQTASVIWTPTSSKRFVLTYVDVQITVTGTLTLFDDTNSAANLVFNGTQPVGTYHCNFSAYPWRSSAINNVLKYTSGSGLTGVLTVHGYEE